MDTEYKANCPCGEIRLTSSAKPIIEFCCHCADCRAVIPHDFATIAFFRKSSCEITGALKITEYIADSGNRTTREACSSCGTAMFDTSDGFPKLLGVMAEQLLPPFESKPAFHVWVSSKLPEVKIPDGVKCYEKGIPTK